MLFVVAAVFILLTIFGFHAAKSFANQQNLCAHVIHASPRSQRILRAQVLRMSPFTRHFIACVRMCIYVHVCVCVAIMPSAHVAG